MSHDSNTRRVDPTPHRAVGRGLLAVLVLATAGCATLDDVRQLPPEAGVRAVYDASTEEVQEVLPGALQEAGMEVSAHRDSIVGGVATIGERGWSLTTKGYYTRALVRSHGDGSQLRVVGQPKARGELFSPAGRASPRLVAAVDEALGPRRIAPFAGMRVRGRTADGTEIDGVLRCDGQGSVLVTSPDDAVLPQDRRAGTGDRPRSLEGLEELSVHRGSYGRGMEGGIIGSLVGIFVGFLVDGGCDDLICPLIPSEVAWGSLVGTLSGGVIGSFIRTDVWSPMEPPGVRR